MTATNDSSQVPTTSKTTWKIDQEASSVGFTSRMRLMFVMKVTVLGRFTDVAGTLTMDEHEPTNSQATVTIGTASLDTKLAARDKHLRSADFFDVEHYPINDLHQSAHRGARPGGRSLPRHGDAHDP